MVFILLIFIAFLLGFFLKAKSEDKVLDSYVNKLISIAKSKDIPELITGKTGYAKNIDIKLFYEELCQTNNPVATVLLINGASETMIQWPDQMIRTILKNKFRVIRFDNRGLGQSDWISNWSKYNSYSLTEMANDTLAVATHLNIKKFHIIGYSMGGMIGQIIAIN